MLLLKLPIIYKLFKKTLRDKSLFFTENVVQGSQTAFAKKDQIQKGN